MKLTKIGEFLHRSKIPVDIEDELSYTRVTIRINHNGVSKRDTEKGSKIGTKKQFYLKAGQFIVSKIDARYGAFGIAPDEVDNAIITGNFWAFDVDNSKVNIEWFNQFTNSPSFYDICERASSGITHRKYLDEKFFLNYEINLPNIDEQLVQIQDIKKQKQSFEKLSTELTHQLTLVKQLRQSFLREAMQGKLTADFRSAHPELIEGENSALALLEKIKVSRNGSLGRSTKKEKELAPVNEDEIPFDIPEGWVWCRLGEIYNIKSGKRIHASDYKKEGIPFLRSGEIGTLGRGETIQDQLYISIEKYHDIKVKFGIPKEGDILIACIGGSIGNTWLVDNREFYYKDGNLVLIESIPTLDTKYLLNYLKCPFFWTNTILNATDSSYNALTIVKLNDAEFPLPPLSEQQAIVSKLDELMRTCDELEASIRISQQQNEMLLREVLREALEKPEEEKVEVLMAAEPTPTYKIPVQSNIPNNKRAFAKQVLGGEIVKLFKDEKQFTNIKFQKLQYLSEQIIEEDLDWNYYRQSAGPYDNKFMHSVFHRLDRNKWFRKDGNKYYPLEKVNDIDIYYQKYFGDKSEKLNNLFALLQKATEKFCEAIATIYAVWNNHIILKQEYNKERIKADFFDWSNRKTVVFTEEEFEKALAWMQKHNIIPTGFGYLIKEKK